MKKILSIILISAVLLSVLIIPCNFSYKVSPNELCVEYEIADDHEELNNIQPIGP
ncbi:hypothetical protein ES703_23895 [subsurface metagenome]